MFFPLNSATPKNHGVAVLNSHSAQMSASQHQRLEFLPLMHPRTRRYWPFFEEFLNKYLFWMMAEDIALVIAAFASIDEWSGSPLRWFCLWLPIVASVKSVIFLAMIIPTMCCIARGRPVRRFLRLIVHIGMLLWLGLLVWQLVEVFLLWSSGTLSCDVDDTTSRSFPLWWLLLFVATFTSLSGCVRALFKSGLVVCRPRAGATCNIDHLARHEWNECAPSRFSPAPLGDVESCAICLEDYAVGDAVWMLPCRHLLHQACSEEWLIRHGRCPVCKAELPTLV